MSAEAAARTWQGIRTLVLDRYDRRKEVCGALDMSFVRVKALRQVACEPMTMRELAARLSIDAPYTTLVVDDLERRELVQRAPHPGDRRAKVVTATPAGLTAADRADRILNQPPAALCALPADELEALGRIVERLLGEAQLP